MTAPRTLAAVGLLTAGLVVGSTAGAVAGTVITSAQIKDGTITSVDVKNGGLGTQDLSPGTVKSLRALTGYSLRYDQKTVAPSTADQVGLSCPAGKRVVGGTGYWTSSAEAVQFAIALDGTGATAYTSGIPVEDILRVQVVCATVTG